MLEPMNFGQQKGRGVEGAVIIEGVKGEAIGLSYLNLPGGGSGLILDGGHDEF